jgi:hypothetical protein
MPATRPMAVREALPTVEGPGRFYLAFLQQKAYRAINLPSPPSIWCDGWRRTRYEGQLFIRTHLHYISSLD